MVSQRETCQESHPDFCEEGHVMTVLVLFVLAVVWAVYLVSWIRSRTEHSRVNSISSFSNHLSILERAAPGAASSTAAVASGSTPLRGSEYFAPHRPKLSPQKKRRRDILFGLAGATGVTLLGAFAFGGLMVVLFLLSLGAFGGYVVLLANAQKQKLERQAKVRYMQDNGGVMPGQAGAAPGAFDNNGEALPRMFVVGGN
jgi:Flp pilus assembly protein TadB